MSRNGSGTYSPPASSFPAVANTLIEAAKFNNTINDIGAALTASISNDGQTPVLANLPMSGFKHTGVAAASGAGEYVEYDQYSSALALKAPIESPTFTGVPAAPTPASSSNDTTIPTTAFVKTASIGIGKTWSNPTRALGTTYTNSGTSPIVVNVSLDIASTTAEATVDAIRVAYFSNYNASSVISNASFIVNPGSTYRVRDLGGAGTTLINWAELA